ncbi:MAG: CvpA family protein [Flavobacteriales bacterium]|nr:CvpA family protein [Flavobacteriales bacterium]
MEYNYLDIIIGAVLVYGLVRGIMKGLIVEIASLLAIIIGVWGAIHFSDIVGDFLGAKFDWDEKYLSLIAFSLTFIGLVITVSMIAKALTSVASVIALGWLNRLLGAIFGILKSALILSVVLTIVTQINGKIEFIKEKTITDSILYKDVSMIAPSIFPMIKEVEVMDWWDKAYENIDDVISS